MGQETRKEEDKRIENIASSPTRKICIPCEDTEFSKRLVEWTKSNMIRPGDKIILVTVRSNFVKIGQSWPKNVIDFVSAYNQKEDEKVVAKLESFKDYFKDHEVDIKVLHGDAKTVLVEFIEDLKPTACILGRCGMQEAKKMLVGHVSDYLVKNLKVPTLLYNFD